MFPMIFAKGIEIGYACTSFKWENNAKHNAGVTVVVIGLRNTRPGRKFIFTDGLQIEATNINGYLTDAPSVFIYRRTTALSTALPRMTLGSMPKDGGHLLLESHERDEILDANPEAARFIKRFAGAVEFINDIERYCLWISDHDLMEARTIPGIAQRLEAVARWRRESVASTTAEYADFPNRFKQNAYMPTESIVVPSISSSRRSYIPMGYLDHGTVISNKAFAVYDAEPWTFAVLTSQMHMAWVSAVSGRMRLDYQYGAYIVYNNFPVPPLAEAIKEKLTVAALRVLDVREYHCERTLAELYDPDLMPEDLRAAHTEVDALVDSIYSKRAYETDEQRLSDLFAMYEAMAAEDASKAPAKKTRGARK
jgi:hypothetical protein